MYAINLTVGGFLVVDGPNDIRITGAAAGATPTIAAEGADANLGLAVVLKGTGTLAVAGQGFSLGANATTGIVRATVNGAAGAEKSFGFNTAGLSRWAFGCSNGAETGANAGSDWFWNRYDDAGNYIDTPFYITRSTGAVGMSKGAAITGGSLDNATVGNTTPAAGTFTTLGLTGSQTAKFALIAPNAAAGAPTWRQILASDVSGLGALATADPAAPPALGGTTANTGRFSNLTATGFLLRSLATGLTASATNTQAGALGLTAGVNNITTAAANSAVRLPNAAPAANTAAEIIVRNGGANAVNVFPPTGASINALAANAAFSLAAGATTRFQQLSATLYITT